MNFVWYMYFLLYLGYNVVCISFFCPPKRRMSQQTVQHMLIDVQATIIRVSRMNVNFSCSNHIHFMQEPIGDGYEQPSQLDVVKIGFLKF